MNENEITRPTVMEISIDNFRYNIEQIKKRLSSNTTIMPIIKANAYGTYINTRLEVINEFEIVGVATVDEGVQIRKLGYQKDIFILNQPAISEMNKIIENDLVIGLSSNRFLEAIGETNENINVHIEIGTGMGRTGVHPYRVGNYLKKLPKNVSVKGIYTHLSVPDIDDEYTKKQLNSFNHAVKDTEDILGDVKYIHAAASNAIINYPEAQYNLVRPGMIMYGYESGEGIQEKITLKPVAKLKSKITLLKTVEKGTSIGYGRSFMTARESKIATIPIGYADGFRRTLSNNGHVVIRGHKVPIVGKICMDGFMADVTDLEEVEIGDDVWIWDNEHITLDEVAHRCNTINYEIISTISNRVPRIFV